MLGIASLFLAGKSDSNIDLGIDQALHFFMFPVLQYELDALGHLPNLRNIFIQKPGKI